MRPTRQGLPVRQTAGVPGLAEDLRAALDGRVADDDWTRHLYSRDASMYAITPQAVAFPRHDEDVAAAVAVAARHGVPVLARGAGTSLAGQCVGPGLVLDLSRHLDRVDIDPGTATAVVEPGVVQDTLNAAAAPYGLMFGPDTSTGNRATLGGMVGNNSAGSGSVRYGMTIDHVRSLDVVLADGGRATLGPVPEEERVRRAAADSVDGRVHRDLPGLLARHATDIATGYPEHWRRAGGYRLDRLAAESPFDPSRVVVGSEGTLAIVTRAVVGLVPRPERTAYLVGHFPAVAAAIDAVGDALACEPVQVELIDRTILDLARRKLAYSSLAVEGDPDALLYVAFSGDGGEVEDAVRRLREMWRSHGHGYAAVPAVTAEQQRALLSVRTAGLGLLMAASTGSRRPVAFIEDTAVPPDRLASYAARLRELLDARGLRAGFYGHASVGCLHVRPFVDTADPAEVATMRALAEEVRVLAAEHGGVNASEHGDGLARSEFNRRVFGDGLYEAMCEVKRVFDPAGLLNPGKVVDAPPMTSHLRVLPPAPAYATTLKLPDDMRAAADRCQNIGLCRNTASGVMCPSFVVTREEEHSPRGRAAALVKALSEPDPAAALADDRLHEMLDLCLMCRACTSECPLDVDISSLKSEALAARHQRHGVPLRSRGLGSVRLLNRVGSAMAPASNVPGAVPALHAVLARALGLAPERPLPRFTRETTVRWYDRRRRPAPATTAEPVTVLADSFTTYTEPSVGIAAVELLERAGHPVRLEADGCCGRPALSKGLVRKAARQARDLASRLGDGTVVAVEPSCFGMLLDEKVLGEAPAPARRIRQVEELVLAALDDGRLRLRDGSWLSGRRVLLHGHCHQKADVGTAATLAMLRRIPGAEVVELDAGCCGMAGSFGFEAEHYAVSMQVGADRLFPAVTAEPADTVLAATGVSCRQQIAHGTGRTARHPLELVRSAVAW